LFYPFRLDSRLRENDEGTAITIIEPIYFPTALLDFLGGALLAVVFLVALFCLGAEGLVTGDAPMATASALRATLKGAFRTCLRIAPERTHCVQARTVLDVPLAVVVRTFCKFGKNVRRVIPVIFVPTPPRYFALPLVSTLFPRLRPFPQISQTRDIKNAP
jgi:hypothetical protein